LALNCDILIPAAVENQIHKNNTSSVKAKIVIEGANGPTTNEGCRILEDKGVFVVPDILANSGGVIVSYFEWVQGLQAFFWNEHEVNSRLETILETAFDEVLDISNREKVNMKDAAYMVAIQRIAQAMIVRGIYP
jgi:glutamate dehydrogenase (NAD(P)+)